MKDWEETGTRSPSYRNALAHAKRKALKECYSFTETVLDAKYQYLLTDEETASLEKALYKYCKKNYLFVRELTNYRFWYQCK